MRIRATTPCGDLAGREVTFGVLGPLLVRDGGKQIEMPAGMPRRVLAVLLLHAGQPCRTAWLSEAIWAERKPADPAGALRAVAYTLRRSLGTAGSKLVAAEGGYLFRAAAEETDLGLFRALACAGRAAWYGGDVPSAASILGAACRLWREPALADIPQTAALTATRNILATEHEDVADLRIDAQIALGEHDSVISELRATTGRDPAREHTWAQLMLALYRSGDQDAAIGAYRDAQAAIANAYGMAPGPELADLRRKIAAGNAARLPGRTHC